MKRESRRVKESRERSGKKPTSLNMNDAQRDKLDAFAALLGMSRTSSIMEAIDNYDAEKLSQISDEKLLGELRRRLKGE